MILALALGVGAAASAFTVVHGVLLAPLPFGQPERLVSLGLDSAAQSRLSQPSAVHAVYARHAQRLDGVGLHRTGSVNLWIEGEDPDHLRATWVSASVIELLRVAPLLGRSFNTDEERFGGPNAVILSEAEWRARFGAAPDVIGRTLMVNSVPRQIVGVMPARFAFPSADTWVWLPVRLHQGATMGGFDYSIVARLAPGASPEQARAELASLLPRLAELFPRLASGGDTARWLDEVRPVPAVSSLRDEMTGDVAPLLWMLATAAGLVLLVAWANVTNLMLVRADQRRHEMAVRQALGAGRWRLASHFLTEAVLLGAAAAALALLATHLAVASLTAFAPAGLPRLDALTVGLPSLVFILVAATLGALVCVTATAPRASRAALPSLHDGARSATVGKGRQRLRAGIAALQIAVALVVSVGSALLLRSAQGLHDVHPGFEAHEVVSAWTLLPFARYSDAQAVAFHARLVERVRELPSVSAAGLALKLPLGGGHTRGQHLQVEGGGRAMRLSVNVVDDGYFAAMRIPLLAGQGFGTASDGAATGIIISRLAARQLFDGADIASVVGRRLVLEPSGPAYTVVGVVGDVRYRDLGTPPEPMAYRPQAVPSDPAREPGAPRGLALVVQSGAGASAIMPAVRRIVRELDPTLPVFNIQPMDEVLRASTARLQLAMVLMTASAVVALLLGAIGLYGVVAYTVGLRSREFGLRLALGASPRQIARSVVLRGLALSAGGIAAGLVLYALVAPLLRSFLFGVGVDDPLTLLGSTLLLAGTAALASWLPARRASRVDPAESLRAE